MRRTKNQGSQTEILQVELSKQKSLQQQQQIYSHV